VVAPFTTNNVPQAVPRPAVFCEIAYLIEVFNAALATKHA
jgi:hypothetical protein